MGEVEKFADGRVILGERAKELGLVDEIGGVPRAAKLALEKAGDKAEPEIIYPHKRSGFMGIFGDLPESRLFFWLNSIGRVRFLYQALV